jgi:hypothetical protein
MMLCRDLEGGYACWIRSGCQYGHRVPFSCKTSSAPLAEKFVVTNITKDMLEVPSSLTDHSEHQRFLSSFLP